ncbi:MAG: hypothetical protein KME05_24255 [Gloeocapsa sp. UFS-A4-WI-NPMV-4B04]|nr:hypothetical protein [Gloeocapsa sp. UFS-A4-WI-NPMV-4B04]
MRGLLRSFDTAGGKAIALHRKTASDHTAMKKVVSDHTQRCDRTFVSYGTN